ncbi:MAG: ABC transporter permease [Pseudomonadales bacterium]|nr:ABC transporter permease [Pseudomonadales bacterium]
MQFQRNLIAFKTIVNKEIRRFMRIWVQTLIPPVITMGLYFVIFGNLIGSRIGTMGGFNYMQYIIPGLIMMSVITNSYSNVVSSFYSTKFQRSIEELLVSPISNYVILGGYVVGGMARGMAVGFIVTLVSLFFSELPISNIGITLLVVIMTSMLFAICGFINAVYARSFDDISIIPTFVLTPLTYLGGVFYSIDLLPSFWQTVSLINPIMYMVNAFRYGILGVSDVDILIALPMIGLFTVLLFSYALWLLNRGVGIRE